MPFRLGHQHKMYYNLCCKKMGTTWLYHSTLDRSGAIQYEITYCYEIVQSFRVQCIYKCYNGSLNISKSHNLLFRYQESFNKGLCPVGTISWPDKHNSMSITVCINYINIINKTLKSCILNTGHLMPPTLKKWILLLLQQVLSST